MYLPPGTIVDDRYEVLSQLGVGGFGAVYSAKQTNLDRIVALKIIHEHEGFNEDGLARFELEAQTLSKLRHKNLALFYGYGVWNDAPYMVLEFVRGKSLQSVIDQEKRLKESRAIQIVKQVCDALACIHSNGIVHRDLKQANIMLVPNDDGTEVVKLIDFGLAKVIPGLGARMQQLTEAGSTVGSAEYMSPEQCMGQPLDGRCDIYALACTLQACLTGTAPFQGEHSVVVMQKHMYDEPPQLHDFLEPGSYSENMQLILNQSLAKNAKDRYESAEEMRADLSKLSGHDTSKLKASAAGIPSALNLAFGVRNKFNITLVAVAAACISGVIFWNWQVSANKHETDVQKGSHRSSMSLFKEARDAEAASADGDLLFDIYSKAIAANEEDKLLDSRLLARAKRRVAYVLGKRKQYDKAIPMALSGLDDYMNAGETDKLFIHLIYDITKLSRQTHEPAVAIKHIKKASDYYKRRVGKPSPDVLYQLANLYLENEQPEEALSIYNQLSELTLAEGVHFNELQKQKRKAQNMIAKARDSENLDLQIRE